LSSAIEANSTVATTPLAATAMKTARHAIHYSLVGSVRFSTI
jgi:hypothetical protein